MVHNLGMIRFELFFAVLVFALGVYCLIDVIGRSDGEIRNLPKIAWIVLILLFPLVGSIAWIVAGRPQVAGGARHERAVPQYPEYDRPGRAAATSPEDDEQFLRKVRERAEEQRRAYRQSQLASEKARLEEEKERQARKQRIQEEPEDSES